MSPQMPDAMNSNDNDQPSFMGDDNRSGSGGSLGVSLEDNVPLDISKMGSGKYSGGLVLVLVVGIAGAALWGMRQMGTSGSKSFANGPEIEYPIDDLVNASGSNDHSKILDQLEASGEVAHIPLDEVLINPFSWNITEIADTTTTTTTKAAPQVDQAEIARIERLRKIESEFSILRLNSVMGGSMPVARISGEMVREGDRLGEFFRVKRISQRSVILTVDGLEYLLSMDQ